jgi:hypothetical protein
MFKKMKEKIDGKVSGIAAELKSKNGEVSDSDKIVLESLI